ncbi:MAG: enoyl-CoA hydratase/isomerase family protein [Bacteroidota bacterium]
MNTFQITINDRLAVIQLDRGRSNPINYEMVQELIACVQDLDNDDEVGGLVLTGKDGFFSSGIDLIEAYGYDQEQSRAFWTGFMQMQTALASFKKPLVAAISGHSPAGGCVMAICADYRIMAEGNYIIGLNEVPVGIIVPDSVFRVYSFWLGKRLAYQYLMEGKLLNVSDALSVGLVDEVATGTDLMEKAIAKIRSYMKFNPVTWSQSKLNLRKEMIAQLNTDQTATLDMMLKQWWAPATRKGLEMMIQHLKSKNS